MKTEDESLLKSDLAVLLKGEVVTLREYLERERRDGGIREHGLPTDSFGEQLRQLLDRTFVLEDPCIPNGLKVGFLGLRKSKFDPLDNSLDVAGDKRKLLGVGMEKLLNWSSMLAQSYFASSIGQCSCSIRSTGDAEPGETALQPGGETQSYRARDFELLLQRHFPRMKRPRGGSAGPPKSEKKCGVCVASGKFQNMGVWETLTRLVGPVEVLFLLVCCIVFKKLGEDSDTLIQQTGRMLTNDFLEELARLREAESKRASPTTPSCRSSSLLALANIEKKQGCQVKSSVPLISKIITTAGLGLGKESRLSRIYNIDIPSHSGILYCDHFSRRGGLPCLSILRLLPPSLLGARTLLRFVIQTDHLFKEHDRQSLIGLLGSYEMTKFSRVRCRLASSMLHEFQKLLLNVRSVSPVDFLGKMCPMEAIKDSDLGNLNSLPVLQFETDLAKVVDFLRLYLIKILPKNILGTFKNLKIFINQKVPIIANLHIRETFSIKHAMNEMEVSKWVNRILEQQNHQSFLKSQTPPQNCGAGSKKVPAETRSRIRKSLMSLAKVYLARNIYFLIVYVVIPILRRHFYATEIEGSNKVRYFRYPIWIKILRQADKGYLDGILRGVKPDGSGGSKTTGHFAGEASSLVEKNLDYFESVPKIRWLPKSKGLRPLLNLSKVGSGQILRQILEERHFCEQKKRGFCDCNSVWTGGELPTSWIGHSGSSLPGGPAHGAAQAGRSFASPGDQPGRHSLGGLARTTTRFPAPSSPAAPTSRVTRRPSSSRILDARRPSTNNMLLYPSKILRSFLLTSIGRRYLGASVLRYEDVYKSIRRWWLSNWEADGLRPESNWGRDWESNHEGNVSHRKIYIIKADLVNCFENIDKARILEFLGRMSLPEEISILSLYSRTLSRTSIIPPFENISRGSSFRDELGRTNIITSRGRLSTIPVFERGSFLKPDLAQDGLPDPEEKPLSDLRDFCTSRNALGGGILGRRKAHILTFLNSRRVISWELAKEMLEVHLNTNFVRLRTVNKSSRLSRTKGLVPSDSKSGRRLQSLFRQSFGIPQGSSISYILCCLYYGFLDLNPQVQELLGPCSCAAPNPVEQEPHPGGDDHCDLETDSVVSPLRYPGFKQDKTESCETSSNNKRRRLDESQYNKTIIGELASGCCCNDNSSCDDHQKLFRNQVSSAVNHSSHTACQQKNILLRWVDDFLFLTSDSESARKFLELLYIQKLWGSNVSKDKISSNFRWTDHNHEIVVLDDPESFPLLSKESPSSILEVVENLNLENIATVKRDKEVVPPRRGTASEQPQKQEVLWSGMKFSSGSRYLNCKISPWKNLEFVCVMDTITLTTNHNKFKTTAVSGIFQKSSYMWSVLGTRLVRYFDFKTRNGLLFDCKINSIRSIHANIVILTYIGTLKLLLTFKRIKKIHQGFVNPKFLAKVLEWISNACCCSIFSYNRQLANRNQWSLLIKCAVYDSIVTCLHSRHKALGISELFRSYKTKLHAHSSILKKEFNLHPQSSLSIIKEHRLELPSIHRLKKGDGELTSKETKDKKTAPTPPPHYT